jgi:hypothetical protein
LPLLELAACRAEGPKSAGRRLRLHKSAGRRDDCYYSAGRRLEEPISYLLPGISSLGILAVTRSNTLFRHFHTKCVEETEECAEKMQKTYIELLLRSAGERTASAGVRSVLAAARSTAVTLLIRPRILAICRLPLQNRPPPLGTLRS